MDATSLYIHFPWCVKKCPYCDFNSHGIAGKPLPFDDYLVALVNDLRLDLKKTPKRHIKSIFLGGGTPSLFAPEHFSHLFAELQKMLEFAPDIEITLEANPGTLECGRFSEYKAVGINRVSLGVQSFNDDMLKKLGRIHSKEVAIRAIEDIHNAGFTRFNLDIMESLPGQTKEQALSDLQMALSFSPPHLSWYQLTLEPGTHFYKRPPRLPNLDQVDVIEEAGRAMLDKAGLLQYEISAYAKPGFECAHNLNYWQFGDYLGIGAGAHSKLTDFSTGRITRVSKQRQPKRYLDKNSPFIQHAEIIKQEDIALEFMLNHLRLAKGFSCLYFERATGVKFVDIEEQVKRAEALGLLSVDALITPTNKGRRFLNDLVEMFMV